MLLLSVLPVYQVYGNCMTSLSCFSLKKFDLLILEPICNGFRPRILVRKDPERFIFHILFRLDMYGEKYKPFKGVKYITKAGRFQVRM